MTTRNLDSILAPIAREVFFGRYCFREPLIVSGHASKFADLFTWDSLNRLLSFSRHDPIRVHLDRVGTAPESMPFTHRVRNVRGEYIERIDVPELYRHLHEGATLVVDAVNEIDPAIAALTADVGAHFSTSAATTVLFCSFGHTAGFAVHWDSRDVFALQVEGEKRWSIFQPSRVAPLDRGDHTIPDSGEPGQLWWEGTIRRGDFVYIPRGWWHQVTSTDSPSLHLNLGFAPITGVDFASWLVEQLKQQSIARMDIPRFTGPEGLVKYRAALVELLSERLHPNCITDFLASRRIGSLPQTRLSLPLGVGPKHATPTPTQRVRLVTELIELVDDVGSPVLRGCGRSAPVPDFARQVIERLRGSVGVSIAELASAVGDVPSEEVNALICDLIGRGFVCLELPGDADVGGMHEQEVAP